MRQEFIIHWRSQVNGRAGRGTKRFNHEEGQKLVEELNREYPQIRHELIEAPNDIPANITGPDASRNEELDPEAETAYSKES